MIMKSSNIFNFNKIKYLNCLIKWNNRQIKNNMKNKMRKIPIKYNIN
jgi:hypothetical protein